MHKFPASTVGQYLPGVGMTITKANIRAENKTRAEKGKDAMTADDILTEFLPKEVRPEQRHKFRASRLATKA